MKLSLEQFVSGSREYYETDSPLRLGQFLVNKFCPNGQTDPTMFYEEDETKVMELVMERLGV